MHISLRMHNTLKLPQDTAEPLCVIFGAIGVRRSYLAKLAYAAKPRT